MKTRELETPIEQRYFENTPHPQTDIEVGTREMGTLHPFIISGGSNTERWYFKHINSLTKYKFNLKPEYFADESDYTNAFPRRINEILSANSDAKIFCVFDWDTIYGNKTRISKHKDFIDKFKSEISKEIVIICQSMPCIEYWFLLHFENYTDLLKNYPKVSTHLAPYIKKCFPIPTIKLKKLLKGEKYLKDATWVKNLIADEKLLLAIQRAETNIKNAIKDETLNNQSYSFVYKIFK